MVHGPWFYLLVHGQWFHGLISWSTVHGPRSMVHGPSPISWSLVIGHNSFMSQWSQLSVDGQIDILIGPEIKNVKSANCSK
jgi:hypothetical protein